MITRRVKWDKVIEDVYIKKIENAESVNERGWHGSSHMKHTFQDWWLLMTRDQCSFEESSRSNRRRRRLVNQSREEIRRRITLLFQFPPRIFLLESRSPFRTLDENRYMFVMWSIKHEEKGSNNSSLNSRHHHHHARREEAILSHSSPSFHAWFLILSMSWLMKLCLSFPSVDSFDSSRWDFHWLSEQDQLE